MRVVSGTARGTTLDAVPGDTTRPILDRVKTAVFDILRPRIQGARFLDLFGGSGSVGIEALSQGAAHCTFLDIVPAAIKTIENNLKKTKLSDKAAVKKTDAFAFLKRSTEKYDLIYVAPPQFKQIWVLAMQHLAERPEMLNPGGQIVVQIDPKEYEQLTLNTLTETARRTYGNTELVFYSAV